MPIFRKSASNKANNPDKLSKLAIAITVVMGVTLGFIFVLMVGTNKNLLTLPPPKQATVFYDINNKEFTRLFVENRLEIPLVKIPLYMKKAIINVEDNRYYEHSGIDIKSIFRAIWVDVKGGGYIEGGSTITQQLARNVLLTQKKAISRKIQEIFLAISIERNYTKDEILERYLNQICFGHGAYGVEAASRLFFGKSITELSLHQIALLAGLPKNPTGYSPYLNPQSAKDRRKTVLEQMVKYGTISSSQADGADNMPLDVIPLSAAKRRAAYFVDYIVRRLKGTVEEDALYTGGYQIYTTLDPLAQQAAEEAAATLTGGKPDSRGVMQPQIALVAIDPRNGYIKAMIGGRDFGNTQLNRASSAYRQSGSAIKPFVYTAAIDSRKYTPSTITMDEPVEYPTPQGPYKPQNYDKVFRGSTSLRHALENSINIIAIKLVENLGGSTVINYARQMGLKSLVLSKDPPNDLNFSALALGGLTKGVTPLELASAYTPLADQGIYADPIAVLEVKDADGITKFSDHSHKKVAIPEATAYLVTDMLRGVIMRGTGKAAMIDRPAAGKTGTTSDYTDAWFVGYTPDLLASVWIGNDKPSTVKIDDVTIGSGRAAEIWGIFMSKALSQTPASDFIPPAGIVSGIEICPQSGELATSNCPETIFETYLAGTEPTQACLIHKDGAANNDNADNIFNTDPNDNSAGGVKQDASNTDEDNTLVQNNSAAGGKKKMVVVRICSASGLLGTSYCPESQLVTELFTEGEEPTVNCNVHKSKQ